MSNKMNVYVYVRNVEYPHTCYCTYNVRTVPLECKLRSGILCNIKIFIEKKCEIFTSVLQFAAIRS